METLTATPASRASFGGSTPIEHPHPVPHDGPAARRARAAFPAQEWPEKYSPSGICPGTPTVAGTRCLLETLDTIDVSHRDRVVVWGIVTMDALGGAR